MESLRISLDESHQHANQLSPCYSVGYTEACAWGKKPANRHQGINRSGAESCKLLLDGLYLIVSIVSAWTQQPISGGSILILCVGIGRRPDQ